MAASRPLGSTGLRLAKLLLMLVPAGCSTSVLDEASGTGSSAILVYSLVAPAPNEQGMTSVTSATGSPPYGCPSIEVAVVPMAESTFATLMDIVAEARLSSPIDDRDIGQTTAFRAMSGDGHALSFGGYSDVRDVDGRVYRLTEEAWDMADGIAQDALSQAGCTTYTELYGLG